MYFGSLDVILKEGIEVIIFQVDLQGLERHYFYFTTECA